MLSVISGQEKQHAQWVKELLENRGISVDDKSIAEAEERYWKHTLPGIDSFETGAAVAAHAENMRLERIRAICSDPESPADIRDVFQNILKDEVFHAKAFESMASEEALEQTKGNHELGLVALGLSA